MAVKLLMTWDIQPGREQEYFEFIVQEFIPTLERLGLKAEDAWFTVYGDYPQILTSVLAEDLPSVQRALQSPEWKQVVERLQEYVRNFDYKVVEARQGFQL